MSKKQSKALKATVSEVVDGDTLKVIRNGKEVIVRIACIDAPEMEQSPYGQLSKDELTGLITINSTILLNRKGTDRYGRLVAEVTSKKGVDYGLAMVKTGYAFVYDEYSSQCDEKLLNKAERTAKNVDAGLWSAEDLTMPWDFRNGTDSNTSKPTPVDSATEITPYTGSRVITCGEIPSKSVADQWLQAGHGYLDADGDGCACESKFIC